MKLNTLKEMFSRILIRMHGEYKYYQLELLDSINKKYGSEIHILCKTNQDKDYYLRSGYSHVHCWMDMPNVVNFKNVFEVANSIEKKYNINLHYYLVDMRNYFTGGYHFPRQNKDDYKSIMVEACNRFLFFDNLFDAFEFTLVLWSTRSTDAITDLKNIPKRNLESSLKGNYYIWFKSYSRDERLIRDAWQNAEWEKEDHIPELAQPESYLAVRKKILNSLSWKAVTKRVLHELARGVYYRLRRYEKAVKFGFSGIRNAKFTVRQKREFSRLMKRGLVGLEQLKNIEYVYYPLAGEPEATLAFCSPEHMDQLSIIQSLSVALPAGTYLAVKEHMIAVGVRPREFYDIIDQMPNVFLVDPLEAGLEVARHARALATIGSSSGVEAALMGIPVLLFGRNNYFDFMPHVHKVVSFVWLHENLRDILNFGEQDQQEWRRAAGAFCRVLDQHAVNFDGLIAGDFKVIDRKVGSILLRSLEESLSHGSL